MKSLSTSQRYRLSKTKLSAVLSPYGFSSEGSKRAVFWRKANDDVYHYIVLSRRFRDSVYDVLVFPHSPSLDTNFFDNYPDNLTLTTDMASNLHRKFGVGVSQDPIRCRTAEGFNRNFDKITAPMLRKHAIPYLDKLRNLSDLQEIITTGPYVEVINKVVLEKGLTNKSSRKITRYARVIFNCLRR